jgi:pyruvate/2-oxoglutarate dehydrogenase complex dihydrolipoamide dehydrogenase (E3) component
MGRHFDFVVIGGGSAGYAAARTSAATGRSVAIVEGGAQLGGLCILRGCMPSKTLIHVADVLHQAKSAGKLGLVIPQAHADMAAVQARKKCVIKDFSDYRAGQLASDRFTLIREKAHFVSEAEIELTTGERISAEHFLVATGSAVNWPEVPGLARENGVWTSDEVLDMDELPESAIVLGGGVVACELAQVLSRLGSRVSLIQRSARILKECSPQAAAVVEKAFADEGIEVVTGTKLLEVTRAGSGFLVRYEKDGEVREVRAAKLVNAMGRSPATSTLNLAAAGIEADAAGRIKTDAFQQTSNPRVYAAGDCCGPVEIVHVAILQGELAATHALGNPCEPVDYDKLTRVIFTDPGIASAGLSTAQLTARGTPFREASYPFDDHGKSILMEAKYGYVKVLAGEGGKILGAECVGRDAGELIHPLAVALALNATCRDLLKAQWYHPTLSEIWTYPLEDLA